jgi:hypothetical protein
MKPLADLTRSQKALIFPLIIGFLAGLVGVIYLFNIPADPKNSIVFGFSLFRLVEGSGLLLVALLFLIISFVFSRKPAFSEKTLITLGWFSKYPWSIVFVWSGLFISLFIVLFGGLYFPGYSPIILRMLPVLYWIILFCLADLCSYVYRAAWNDVRKTAFFLLQISAIFLGLGIALGTMINPAKFGLLLRQGSLGILLILFADLVFALNQKGISGYITSFLIIGLLFGGAIIGVWSNAISDLNIVTGLLPFNDANGYFHGGRLVAEGQLMFPFSAKRPLFSAIMGVFLWLSSQNLQFTIGCFVFISFMVVFFSTQELNKSIGAPGAAFFALGIFIFSRRFIGSTMSEIIGLPLGTIGFAFIWSGAIRQRLKETACGILLVTLGLLSRAGPFFILPLLVIWSGWGLRGEKKYNWKAFFVIGAAVGAGFIFNTIIYYFLAGSNSAPMGNFSYTLYGLVVGGKGWKQYIVDHPNVKNLVEPFQSRAIYRYAWEAFISNPFATVQGSIKYWGDFLNFQWYGAFGYIEGASNSESLAGRVLMAILSLAGLATCIKRFKIPAISMLLVGVIGIFLSVPFVPPLDAEIRTYAAAIPWFVSLGMVGLIGIIDVIKKSSGLTFGKPESVKNAPGLWASGLTLIFLMVIAPLIVHAIKTPIVIPQQTSCLSGEESAITTVNRGSYINIRKDESMPQSMIPDVRYSDFVRSMHDSPMYRLAVQLLPVSPGTSYLTSYNWAEKRFENILAPTEMLDQNQGWVEMCGWREAKPDEYGFFHAESIRLIK